MPTLRRLADGLHELVLTVTQPARSSGRGLKQTPTPVMCAADELGLPAVETPNVNAPEFVDRIRSLNARLIIVVAFGQKLGPEFLSAAPGGAVNLHASLLPKYRGAAPIQWAVVRGESETGNTVFRIVSRMDAGPILSQNATPIDPTETAGELHDRLSELGVQTVLSAIEQFVGNTNPPGRNQDDSLATLAPKIKKTDGIVDFSRPARQVVDHIRGMTPWPGATAQYVAANGRSETVTIVRAGISDVRATAALMPGLVTDSLTVNAVDGTLNILEIKPESGRVMFWRDFVNGRHVRPGDRFVTLGAVNENHPPAAT